MYRKNILQRGLVAFKALLIVALLITTASAQSLFKEKALLLASNRQGGDYFGASLGIDGNFCIIGAPNKTVKLKGATLDFAGTAYIFERDVQGRWLEKAILYPPDLQAEDAFGIEVAISGYYALVSAIYRDLEKGADYYSSVGAVYVFARQPNGQWINQAILLPPDAAADDYFGYAISLSGNLCAVGAPYKDLGNGIEGEDAGAVYIFELDPKGNWVFRYKFVSPEPQAQGLFGKAVAIDKNICIVGACGEKRRVGPCIQKGRVYVLEKDSRGSWQYKTELVPKTSPLEDIFGYDLALRDNLCLVGVLDGIGVEKVGNGIDTVLKDDGKGMAILFLRDPNGNWQEQAALKPLQPQPGSDFGITVALGSDYCLVGAPCYNAKTDENLLDTGAVYLFVRDNLGHYQEVAMIQDPSPSGFDNFGTRIAARGNTFAVGSLLKDDPAGIADCGAVFVYER